MGKNFQPMIQRQKLSKAKLHALIMEGKDLWQLIRNPNATVYDPDNVRKIADKALTALEACEHNLLYGNVFKRKKRATK